MAENIQINVTGNANEQLKAIQSNLKGIQSSTTGVASSVNGLSNAFKGLAATIGIGTIVNYADQMTSLQNKLRAFSATQEEANKKFSDISAIAARSRSEIGAVGDLYGKMSIASQQLGLSQGQVAQVTETFAKSLKVGGANAQESASAILQFSQAMGSGVLRGEEFNAVFEASPTTMLELANALGVPIGQMRKLAEDGKLTSEVVTGGILKMTEAVEEKFGKTVPTIGESLQQIGNNVIILFNNIEQSTGVFSTIAEVIAVVAKHLDVLGIAMGVAFGAYMLANIQKMTLAMRAFAASNPFTLIAMAVGVLIVAVAELIETYGGFGNAMKAVGNMAIGVVNKMINAYKGFGIFIGHLMVGVGKAILAGLNPFSNKSAMGELQAGFQKGLAAAQKQLAAAGPIKFKFDVAPVAAPKINAPAGGRTDFPGVGDVAGKAKGKGKGGKSAAEDAAETAERMREQAAAAREVTQELVAQNAASNEMRELEISLIGMASEYGSLIKANAQARKTAAEEIRGLEAKIVEEQAKGKESNAGVIVELKAQIVEKQKQLDTTLKLNQSEKDRTTELGLQKNILEQQLGVVSIMNQLKTTLDEEGLRSDLIRGKISKEQYDRQIALGRTTAQYNDRREQQEKTLADLTARNATVEADALRRQMELESASFELKKGQTKIDQDLNDKMRKSARASFREVLVNAKAMSEPFVVAEQMTTSLFNSMTSAIDTLIDGGKFKFKDFAKSVIGDLTKIALKAAALRIFELVGSAVLGRPVSIPKLAAGGPTMAGKPYIVGEQGPELFVPNSAGSIMTNASMNKNSGIGERMAPIVNNTYITNNINALDSRSVAQVFVENRKSLLGAASMASREMPYGG
jgi:tape measure domain-containing protein